jgi:thiosulfate/3-mercaptopyruvate sulfurtransferase
MDGLVSTDWLAGELGSSSGQPLRVVDVRWYLDPARRGRDAWRAGHIPGAIFLDVDEDLSAPGGGRGRPAGRHPWPDAAQVARVMGRAGIGEGTPVVAYDDAAGSIAARLWYLLRAYGHDEVAVLDGGIAKWQAEGRPLSTDEPRVAPAEFVPRARPRFVVGKPEMVKEHERRLVLDARALERYRGEKEPIDPVAERIPSAKNRFNNDNISAEGTFKSPDVLRAEFEKILSGKNSSEVINYCGSGVAACHNALAMEVAGLTGSRVYIGSWSEWSADPTRPISRSA